LNVNIREPYKNIFSMGLCFVCSLYLAVYFKPGLEAFAVVCALAVYLSALYPNGVGGKAKGRRSVIILAVFSFMLSIAVVLQNRIHFSGGVGDHYTVNYFLGLSWKDGVALFALCHFVYHLLVILLLAVNKISSYLANVVSPHLFGKIPRISNRKFFLFSLAGILALWAVYVVTYFPGNAMNDTYWMLQGDKFHFGIARQHPFFYVVLLRALVFGGQKIFGGITAGMALYVTVQTVFAAACVSYCLTWLYRKRCPAIFVFLSWCCFALVPFYAANSAYIVKDVFFGVTCMLYVPLLYELYETGGLSLAKKSYLVKLAVVSAFLVLTRNNGIYVVSGLVVGVALLFWGQRKVLVKPFCVFLVFGLVVPACLVSVAAKTFVKQEPLFQETIAIPLQQVAMTVVSGGEITAAQKEFLFSVYPEEAWFEYYRPMTVDSLKWSPNPYARQGQLFLQEHKTEFIKTWFEMLPKNINFYTKAYLMETVGFWRLSFSPAKEDFPINYEDMRELGVTPTQIWPDRLQATAEYYYQSNYSALPEGTVFWIAMFFIVVVLLQKRHKKIIVFVPLMTLWLTLMISVPIAFSARYVYAFYYCLPFIACAVLLLDQNDAKKEGASI